MAGGVNIKKLITEAKARLEKKEQDKKSKFPKNFDMLAYIKEDRLYKLEKISDKNQQARQYINKNCKRARKDSIYIGQMIMFEYFQPITKEQLEYYDAKPCTIFFGIRNTENGSRVLGFNIHYLPPETRYVVVDKIFSMFKSAYKEAWNNPLNKSISKYDYSDIIYNIQQAKLDWCIRMYDPNLMKMIIPLPVNLWTKAVFTEGKFYKKSRDFILSLWNKYNINPKYTKRTSTLKRLINFFKR